METAYSFKTGPPNAAAAGGGLRNKDPFHHGMALNARPAFGTRPFCYAAAPASRIAWPRPFPKGSSPKNRSVNNSRNPLKRSKTQITHATINH